MSEEKQDTTTEGPHLPTLMVAMGVAIEEIYAIVVKGALCIDADFELRHAAQAVVDQRCRGDWDDLKEAIGRLADVLDKNKGADNPKPGG